MKQVSYRDAGSAAPWQVVGDTPGPEVLGEAGQQLVHATIQGLNLGQLYEFKVFVRNYHEGGYEGKGSPVVVTGPRHPPAPPANVRITAVTAMSLSFAWDAPEGSSDSTIYNVRFLPAFSSREIIMNEQEKSVVCAFDFVSFSLL
jgi:hypothetical protein